MKYINCVKLPGIILCIYAFFFVHIALAYSPTTHAIIAKKAVDQSNLSLPSNSILQDLGLDAFDVQSFQNPEPDASIDAIAANKRDTIEFLVRDGAAFEDLSGRPVNHFYDPINNAPLSKPGFFSDLVLEAKGLYPFLTSPDWALQDEKSQPASQQVFSLDNLNEYYNAALTSGSKQTRDMEFGLVFDTLGHVLHHIGDMAQPQHVRDDMHCDELICVFNGKYNRSRFEDYTGEHNDSLIFSGYSINQNDFQTARSFWTTTDSKGLAQFTNGNFVSQGTNFQADSAGKPSANSKYHSPAPGATTYVGYQAVFAAQDKTPSAQITTECSKTANECAVMEIGSQVNDAESSALTGFNPYASSYSIFDQDLRLRCVSLPSGSDSGPTQCRLPALYSVNFKSALSYLIPRAVAYSTGLINYVFRGRLDVQPDPAVPGNYIVTNLSTYTLNNGSLTFYYDDADGNRHPVPSPPQSITTLTPQGKISVPVTAPFDSQPVPAYPGRYIVVFKGTVGSEPGIAGKLITPQNLYVADDGSQNGFNGQIQIFGSSDDILDIETDYSNSPSTGQQLVNVAVYGGVMYVEGTGSVSKMIGDTSQIFADYSGQRTAQGGPLLSNIAANGNGVYVGYVNTSESPTPVHVDRYNFDGSLAGQQLFPEFNVIQGLSVNSDRMCVTGYSDAGKGLAELKDLAGTTKATLASDPGNGGGPCASTRDRHYLVVLNTSSDITVQVYDNDGHPLRTLDVSGVYYASGIAATDSNIYITYSYGPNQGIVVFNRTVTTDPSGNVIAETFTPGGTFDANSGNLFGDAVDMETVLGTSTASSGNSNP